MQKQRKGIKRGCKKKRKTRVRRLVSFHSTYGFLQPLFYAFKQEGASLSFSHYPLLRKGYKDNGFARSMQTRSIRLVSFHSTYRFLVLRIQTKDNGFARSMRTFYPLRSQAAQAARAALFAQKIFFLSAIIPCWQRDNGCEGWYLFTAPMDSCILCFTHSNKKYKVVRSTYGFLYPLFYALKLRLREKYAKLLSLLRIENLFSFSLAGRGIMAC